MLTNLCAIQPEDYYLILAAVAVVAVIVAVIAVIISRKKKKKPSDSGIIASREKLNANVQAVEPLLVLAAEKPEIIQQLETLQQKLKYLTPTESREAANIDGKINNALGDLKIELSKTKDDKKTSGKAQKYIDEIELLIAERSAYTEK